MKMKRMTAVAMGALLGSLSANAALVTLDIFDGGVNGPGDLNTNILPDRQSGSPVLSSYNWGGAGTPGAQILNLGAPFIDVMHTSLTAPVGGDNVTVQMNTDYGTALGGQEWQISYDELVQPAGGASGTWGGWSGIFVGQTIGFGADFGFLQRPDGAFSVFNGFSEIASGGAGSMVGENTLYSLAVSFDEVANTVTVSQDGTDVGTWATTLSGTSRFVQFRTHYDGGSATAIDTFKDNVLIETIPEPATLGLFVLIGGCMLWVRKHFQI